MSATRDPLTGEPAPAALPDAPVRRPLLRIAAERSVQLLVVAAAAALVAYGLWQIKLVVVPVFVALLITALLSPPARWLERRRWPASLAAGAVVGGGMLVLFGLITLLVTYVVSDLETLTDQLEDGLREIVEIAAGSPFNLSERELNRLVDDVTGSLQRNTDSIVGGALLVTEVVAGALLAVVLTFFLVRDGRKIWRAIIELFPFGRRPTVVEFGERAWAVAGGYVRGLALVATVDTVLIGAALLIIGVPLAVPLMAITFLAAFFPVVGAITAGGIAALIALVSNGPVAALVVIGVTTLVQQLEGNFLYPVVVGKVLSLHPIVVLLAVTTGAVTGGVVGAFVSVPVAAVIGAALTVAREERDELQDSPLTIAASAGAGAGGVRAP